MFCFIDVMEFIKDDIKNRLDLGLHWIFGEYSLKQGFISKALPIMDESATERLDRNIYGLLQIETLLLMCT